MWPFKKRKTKPTRRYKISNYIVKDIIKYADCMPPLLLGMSLDHLDIIIDGLQKNLIEFEVQSIMGKDKKARKIYSDAYRDSKKELDSCFRAYKHVMKRSDWINIKHRHVKSYNRLEEDSIKFYREVRRLNALKLKEKHAK